VHHPLVTPSADVETLHRPNAQAIGRAGLTTSPCAWVRHQMSFGDLLYLVGTPLALGSSRVLGVFAPLISVLIWRLWRRTIARERVGELRGVSGHGEISFGAVCLV